MLHLICGVAYDENRCGPIRIRKCRDTNKLLTIRLYSCKILGKVAFAAISLHKLHAYVFNILTFLLKDNSSIRYFQKLNIYYFMSAHFKYSLALLIVGNKIIMIVILLNIEKQPPEVFFKKRCSQKFFKIHRKTPVPESLFYQSCNFIKKETLAQASVLL